MTDARKLPEDHPQVIATRILQIERRNEARTYCPPLAPMSVQQRRAGYLEGLSDEQVMALYRRIQDDAEDVEAQADEPARKPLTLGRSLAIIAVCTAGALACLLAGAVLVEAWAWRWLP